MHDVTVIDDPAAAEVSLDPVRAAPAGRAGRACGRETLAARTGPRARRSTTTCARSSATGSIELIEERRKGNCTERVLQATAAAYVISPPRSSAVCPTPSGRPISARRAGCSARRAPRLRGRRAHREGGRARQTLATFAINTDPLASAADRAAFAAELGEAVNGLAGRTTTGREARAKAPPRRRPAPKHHQRRTRAHHEPRIRDPPRDRPARRARRRLGRRPTTARGPVGSSRDGSPPEDSRPGTRRTASSSGWRRDGCFNALEYTIDARDGGTTLSYVHSGILDDEGWDDQYDAGSPHDFYLHTLGSTSSTSPGRRRTSASPRRARRPYLERREAATAERGAGDRRRGGGRHGRTSTPAAARGRPRLRAGHFVGVRTDDGLYRFFGRNAFGGVVGMAPTLPRRTTPRSASRRCRPGWTRSTPSRPSTPRSWAVPDNGATAKPGTRRRP